MTKDDLIRKAADMKARAYCPYSGFAVGAALECSDGTVYMGCNIENSAFGATICAERTAAAKAVSEGHRDFTRIAIVGSSENYCTPCGTCRQFLAEFASADMEIICVSNNGAQRIFTLSQLLPESFKS